MDPQRSTITFNTKDEMPEEKKFKQEDETSISSTEDTVLTKPFKLTHFVVDNIRFTPKMIEFVDAFEGKQFMEKLTIQNVGKNPVVVKIGEPNSFIFQLKKPSLKARFLPAGASITKTITYTYHSDDLVQKSQIPVHVNGCLIDYPIIVKQAEPEIEVHPQKLNFKVINLGASAKSMTLTIRNTGGRRTNFEVDCGKNLDLVVSPMRGTVKPKHSVNVCVEIMGFREGEYYRELWIKTTETPIRVPVLVEVVRPRLEIVYPTGTENFTLINFRPTFRGTQRASSFLLKNVSNETTMFVVLAEVDGKLVSLQEGIQLSESFAMFKVSVEDGILAPFENRIFNVLFCPKQKPIKKGWHHEECRKKLLKGKTECDQIAFLWIQTVYYMERRELAKAEVTNLKFPRTDLQITESAVSNELTRRNTRSSVAGPFHSRAAMNVVWQRMERSLRFCLHGQVLDPDILIQPNSLEFGELNLGQSDSRVLRLTNNGKVGVRCKICKTMNVITQPQSVWLKGEKAHEFLVRLTPKCGGNFKLKMQIQILAQSDFLDGRKGWETIAVYTVIISYIAHDIVKTPAPKLGLGITPLVVDEVGFQKDSITYKDVSTLPYAAVLDLKKGFKPEWMKREKAQVSNVENALVALPNDRPRNFHSWPKDKVCRSIFKGFFRYSPPEDLAYTLSAEGRLEKKERRAIWAEYISKELGQLNHPGLKELSHLEEEVTFRPVDLECRNLITSKIMKKSLDPNEKLPKLPLIPLSPLFLFRINVEPKMLNFGIVAVATQTQETITINNKNPFPINVRFIPGTANVSVLDNYTTTIAPLETRLVNIVFESKDFGRYFGFLNYVINGAHEFKITISAFVTNKTLFVNYKHISLEFKKYGSKGPFQHTSIFLPLENILPTPVRYRMTTLEDSAFVTEITKGEAPAKSVILTEVSLALAPGKSLYSEVSVISESGQTELVKVACPLKKVMVDFLNNEIDMGDIPLNLPTKTKPVILNACHHDVSFELLAVDSMPDVTIMPKSGIIRARSFFYLEITVKIPVAMKFSFKVAFNIHFSHKITLTVTGNVVHPLITIRPSEVVLKKIWDQSLDVFTICATNEGTTRAELRMDFTRCPEHLFIEGDSEIDLPPYQSRRITFHFNPINVARYVFYLPFVINQILGPPMIQEHETEFSSYFISEYEKDYSQYGEISNVKVMLPCVSVNCIVINALLQVAPLNIVFQKHNLEFQAHNVEITNVSDREVTFCVNIAHLVEDSECPFHVTPVKPGTAQVKLYPNIIKATLNPHQKLVLRTTFKPRKYGLHTVDIPIHVKEYNRGLPFNRIQLSGTLEAPRILPLSSEVYFPPLPLGVACEAVVKICTENYRNPETIRCFHWNFGGESHTSLSERKWLTTKWLMEPQVTEDYGTHVFKLQIIFQSFVPVSLRSYILLIDSEGVYSTILVSAVADNSAVSLHTFLMKKSLKYKLKRDAAEARYVAPKVKEENVKKTDIKADLRFHEHSKSTVEYYMDGDSPEPSVSVVEEIEKGPVLVIQMTKSMSNLSQLDFATVLTTTPNCKATPTKMSANDRFFTVSSPSESLSIPRTQLNTSGPSMQELPYPCFPSRDNVHWEYFNNLLVLVERWIFEVVMRCDQYLFIPDSFQRITKIESNPRNPVIKGVKSKEKDFLNFLEEIVAPSRLTRLPKRPLFSNKETATSRADAERNFFQDILRFLQNKGCLLPHIQPEYLMEYDEYEIYIKNNENVETFSWDNTDLKKTKGAEDPSTQSRMDTKAKDSVAQGRHPSRSDVIPKQASSVLFPKEFWEKSYSGSVHFIGAEPEKVEDGNQETIQGDQPLESSWNLLGKKQFHHRTQVLDKDTFQARSTQAWLDIIIQIFRVLVLSKLIRRNTIPQVKIYEMSEKKIIETVHISSVRNYFKRFKGSTTVPIVDSLSSNVYTSQERILLAWLNHHLQAQKDILWPATNGCDIRNKILNNFDKDLSDSVALISLTAAHCPYIVSEHFKDVFAKPDTPNKILHNAASLVQAWRTLHLGMSVNTGDIISPNPVFMIMLLTHLYDALPSLHPHQCLCFSAPLNSTISRTILLKNESQQRVIYEGKFFGEGQRFFELKEAVIEVKPQKTAPVTIIFSVKKIRKVSATLFLSGFSESPHFAKNLAFYLEGEPSVITEFEKMSFTATLHKVICADIPVKPPYSESAKYEIWYTTKKPEYSGNNELSLKPWSSILKTRVSRRLFLNKSEIKFDEGMAPASLNVTVACLTPKKRNFWIMFRSEIGDFIILIEIKAKLSEEGLPVNGYYSDLWSPSAQCTCSDKTARKFNVACPFLVVLKIPARNNDLWNALRKMFFKSLGPHEVPFWNKHFELDIGICLILWLMNQKEEEVEVVDEFVEVLSTRVTFTLQVDAPDKDILLPAHLEIPDVREDKEIDVPMHISKYTPSKFKLVLTAENKKEIRPLLVTLQRSDAEHSKIKTTILGL